MYLSSVKITENLTGDIGVDDNECDKIVKKKYFARIQENVC